MKHRRDVTRGALRARPAGDDSGMTLIEVVIAAVLLGVLASAVLGVILQTQAVQVGNRARIAAANIAAREIDIVREEFLRSDAEPLAIAAAGVVTNPHPLSGGMAGQPLVMDGVAYTVVRSAAWNITGSGESACEGGSLVAYPTLGVTVQVTWPNMGTIQPVVSTASMAPDKGSGIPTTAAFVAVTVSDSAAEPNPGRTVRVTNGAYVRTGLTDASGCAVIQVEPATGTGTEYTVSLGDAGYVDINSSQTPSKSTGLLARGQLSGSVSFAYDRAGEVRLTLVDVGGAPLPAGTPVAGAQVTLVASESSGPSGDTVHTVSDVVTTISGLWPTHYGAFFGTVAPAGGYQAKDLTPGGSIDLEVLFEWATTTVTGTPAGTTQVIAVPAGPTTTTCTSAGALTVDAADVSLLPGNWDFFAVGATFGCSPGPVAVPLGPGINDPVEWAVTTLQVSQAPAGTLWALERSKVAGPLSTCPGSAAGSVAVNIEASRTGPMAFPAADWYLYVTNGAANGTCVSFPTTFNPRQVPYGIATTVSWPAPPPVTVNITDIPWLTRNSVNGRYVYTYPAMVASSATSVTCSSGTFTGGTWTALGSSSSLTASLAQGTWYIYAWDKRTSGTGIWNPRCKHAGTVIAGPNSPLTLRVNANYTPPATVGP